MAWQDRPYYRDSSRGSSGNPLMWLLTGSVGIGTWFGIRVRIHASMIIILVIALLLPGTFGGPRHAVYFGTILFGIVLLHEFGHCFASRWVGGNPTEILLYPLGGLAFADAPRRPWATFITVVGGPAVNVIICIITGLILTLMGFGAALPINLFEVSTGLIPGRQFLAGPLWWIFTISWGLLLFNLWPVFPLDGGQMLQSLLWVKFGYYRATMWACTTGMIGAGIMAAIGLATGALLLLFIAISGFMTCMNLRQQLQAAGPWGFQDDDPDYGASLSVSQFRQKKQSKWAIRRAEKQARQEREEQERIDSILAKVSAQGMHSLSWREKRTLQKATERQRQADLARRRPR